jgi:hypothetical protein
MLVAIESGLPSHEQVLKIVDVVKCRVEIITRNN